MKIYVTNVFMNTVIESRERIVLMIDRFILFSIQETINCSAINCSSNTDQCTTNMKITQDNLAREKLV